MKIPENPVMLMSFINMKLRDGDYDSFTDFCLSEGIDEKEVLQKLKDAGFEYIETLKQFR